MVRARVHGWISRIASMVARSTCTVCPTKPALIRAAAWRSLTSICCDWVKNPARCSPAKAGFGLAGAGLAGAGDWDTVAGGGVATGLARGALALGVPQPAVSERAPIATAATRWVRRFISLPFDVGS